MFRKKSIIFLVLILVIGVITVIVFLPKKTDSPINTTKTATLIPSLIPTLASSPTKTLQKINQNVLFAAQAPFGDWKDPRQQDGCEEVSSLLAVKWAKSQSLTKEETLKEILAISKFEKENYGSYHDTSAKDTAERILKGYFGFTNYKVKENIELQDIINEIEAGNILITPMNGQILGNPNYTAPGPDRHMLVIRGYDPIKKQIITNDVGTRQGENYVYNQTVFFNSIRDYPTGNHLPIFGNQKSMIIVYPTK